MVYNSWKLIQTSFIMKFTLGLFCGALGLFAFCFNLAYAEPTTTNESGSQLTIEMRDGSRVVGKPLEDTLRLRSTMLGDMKLSWASIRSIAREETGNNLRLMTTDGDEVSVQFTKDVLSVKSSFGKTELPVNLIRSLNVSSPDLMDQIFSSLGSIPNLPFHIAYIVPAGTVGNQQFTPQQTQSLGMDFDVNTPVEIGALGVFDSGGNGLLCKLHARIYDRDTRISVADIEFTPYKSGFLIGGSRYLKLKNPLKLKQGFHGTICVAYLDYPGAVTLEPDGNIGNGSGNWTTDGDDGAISFVGGRYSTMGDGDTFPDNVASGSVPNTFASGTFIFKRSP